MEYLTSLPVEFGSRLASIFQKRELDFSFLQSFLILAVVVVFIKLLFILRNLVQKKASAKLSTKDKNIQTGPEDEFVIITSENATQTLPVDSFKPKTREIEIQTDPINNFKPKTREIETQTENVNGFKQKTCEIATQTLSESELYPEIAIRNQKIMNDKFRIIEESKVIVKRISDTCIDNSEAKYTKINEIIDKHAIGAKKQIEHSLISHEFSYIMAESIQPKCDHMESFFNTLRVCFENYLGLRDEQYEALEKYHISQIDNIDITNEMSFFRNIADHLVQTARKDFDQADNRLELFKNTFLHEIELEIELIQNSIDVSKSLNLNNKDYTKGYETLLELKFQLKDRLAAQLNLAEQEPAPMGSLDLVNALRKEENEIISMRKKYNEQLRMLYGHKRSKSSHFPLKPIVK